MKKFLTSILAALCLFVSVCFVGCKKTGPLPNGSYGAVHSMPDNYFQFTENSIRNSCGWEIMGDTAELWISGYLDYKAKVVEENGKIYFKGYQWVDVLYFLTACSTEKQGSETVYEVVYDETAKSITLTVVEK